jgi:hypothetical protein
MAIKPILFNTEMVRAILDGRKSCTRRLVKPEPQGYFEVSEEPLYVYDTDGNQGKITPPYQPGDILYVRETWHKYIKRVGKGESCRFAEFYGYRASVANSEDADEPWRPSIHMPKEAARIWLKVTDVKVERLQEMKPVDVIKEGAYPDCWDCLNTYEESGSQCCYGTEEQCSQCDGVMMEWEKLWNSTIKKTDIDRYGWDANPWVWVIEFERCEKPKGEN